MNEHIYSVYDYSQRHIDRNKLGTQIFYINKFPFIQNSSKSYGIFFSYLSK